MFELEIEKRKEKEGKQTRPKPLQPNPTSFSLAQCASPASPSLLFSLPPARPRLPLPPMRGPSSPLGPAGPRSARSLATASSSPTARLTPPASARSPAPRAQRPMRVAFHRCQAGPTGQLFPLPLPRSVPSLCSTRSPRSSAPWTALNSAGPTNQPRPMPDLLEVAPRSGSRRAVCALRKSCSRITAAIPAIHAGRARQETRSPFNWHRGRTPDLPHPTASTSASHHRH